jgi:hypothetical protein
VRLRPHSHTKCGLRSPPQHHISYKWSSSQRDAPPLQPSFIHLSKSPVYEPTHIPGSPWMERVPHGVRSRCPYPETFLTYLSGSPVKELPPEAPLRSLFRERERRFIHKAPFIHLSKSPVDEPSFRYPTWGPYGKRCPSPEPFLHILQGPQQGSPPSRFPPQFSNRERERDTTPLEHLSTISQSPR